MLWDSQYVVLNRYVCDSIVRCVALNIYVIVKCVVLNSVILCVDRDDRRPDGAGHEGHVPHDVC